MISPDTRAIAAFLEEHHHAFAADVGEWASRALAPRPEPPDDGAARTEARELLGAMGAAGWLEPVRRGDWRGCCLAREALAAASPLADAVFALQGLGALPILLAGDDALKARFAEPALAGRAMAAFAMTESGAGSDVASIATRAVRDGSDYVLDGAKAFISNAGIADFYTVFARTGEGPGARGLSAFVVPAETPGLMVAERIEVMAPHPLATLRFDGCRVPAALRLGAPGAGFKLAMRTLDVFRTSVAAAALGMGLRALDEARAHAARRRMFGQRLADFQLTQAKLADMALPLDAAALLTWRAAWVRDVQGARGTTEAAMAKLAATEWASDAIDAAVQLFGGRGVRVGETVEALYREIRALRIYEGASEVQKLIIGRALTDVAVAPPVQKEHAR